MQGTYTLTHPVSVHRATITYREQDGGGTEDIEYYEAVWDGHERLFYLADDISDEDMYRVSHHWDTGEPSLRMNRPQKDAYTVNADTIKSIEVKWEDRYTAVVTIPCTKQVSLIRRNESYETPDDYDYDVTVYNTYEFKTTGIEEGYGPS